MLIALIRWWYGRGMIDVWRSIGRHINHLQLSFAIPVLLRSLVSPWRQIVAVPGRSMDEKLRAVGDNLISRTIGFFIRLGTLIMAFILIVLSSIFGLLAAISWPLLPLGLLYCLVRTVLG